MIGQELQKALRFSKTNSIEEILVYEISRLGRRTAEVLTLLESLKKDGIKVNVKSLGITINGNGATEAINKFIIAFTADLARMESEKLSYRIKSGRGAKEKGFKSWSPIRYLRIQRKLLTKHKKLLSI